jgi:hypothetical protein
MIRGLSIIGLAALTLASAASAQDFTEIASAAPAQSNHGASGVATGDAGETILTANVTSIAGPLVGLSTIRGTLNSLIRAEGRSADADLYSITITLPDQFSATVTSGGGDSALALFDYAGRGVWYNDNRTDSTTSTSARLSSIPGLTSGHYFLAITRVLGGAAGRQFNRPLDSMGNLLFPGPLQNAPDSPADLAQRRSEVGPVSPTAALASWETFPNTLLGFNSGYTITLTGATYAVPAPGAAALMGAAGLLALRRRR